MAQYKVPQDVEADDKLVGPFTFRQLCYLFIAFGLGALAVLLFNIFPLLAAIPVPFILFLLVLCNPFKKDQPMETYLAALINFYLKPNKRFWNPGQRESTITITAPKKIEGPRIRAISEDEASHRLSFLADIVDSNGQAVRENWSGAVQEEYVAEAAATPDIFENYDAQTLTSRVADQSVSKHDEAVEKMRAAIAEVEGVSDFSSPSIPSATPTITHGFDTASPQPQAPTFNPSVISSSPNISQTIIQPTPIQESPTIQPQAPETPTPTEPELTPPQPIIPVASQTTPQQTNPPNPARTAAMEQLANNNDFTVATIAKEANRIQNNNDNDVYISLH
ncbi:PrgI family protein [Candidatus Saccharibacteria bacterium]|nr:PrgI family protein [Candidatus Saccharibacteria bacterium]